MRYLITGGAGFIGSHVAEELVARGDEVTILDDLSTGRMENIEHLHLNGSAQFIRASVTNAKLVNELVKQCDCCLHLASAVGVKLVVSSSLDTLQRTARGTEVVVSACARHDKRLLFASTSEVYGKSSGEALHEESDSVLGSPLKSRWSYAIAKAYGEALAQGYHREQGLRTVTIRLFNTIGPRQRGAYGMVVPRLARQAIAGEDMTVYGNGTQSRCFLHVRDAVRAIVSLAEHEGAVGRVFNVGNGRPTTILELARKIIERSGSSSRIRLVPYDEAYAPGFEELGRRRPDISELHELVGWKPQISLEDALDDVIAFQLEELAAVGVHEDVNGWHQERAWGLASSLMSPSA